MAHVKSIGAFGSFGGVMRCFTESSERARHQGMGFVLRGAKYLSLLSKALMEDCVARCLNSIKEYVGCTSYLIHANRSLKGRSYHYPSPYDKEQDDRAGPGLRIRQSTVDICHSEVLFHLCEHFLHCLLDQHHSCEQNTKDTGQSVT